MSVTCALLATAASGAVADTDRDSGSVLVGIDGLLYTPAPLVVDAGDSNLYYGPEFDVSCGLGKRLERSVNKMAKLASIIERSGRRVVFTVAPNKTSVVPLPSTPYPHGECDEVGIRDQNNVLDHYKNPDYLPLRKALVRDRGHQVYWKKDPHWTTVGGSVFAKALATRLDPRVGRHQRYAYGQATLLGMLDYFGSPETLETATPAGQVKVKTAPGTPEWAGYPDITFNNSWVSSPARLTIPGRTLILGDSFSWYALENLRPAFHKGQYIWFAHEPGDVTLQAIKQADTVVIESYQTLLPSYPLFDPAFLRAAKKSLGVH